MADTGWLNFVNFETIPDSGKGWSYPTRAVSSDDSRSSVYLAERPQDESYSEYIHAYEIDFDTAILPSSLITGIQVRVERRAGWTSTIEDNNVYLAMDGANVGDDRASSVYWPTTDAYKIYGASDDLWGTGFDLSDVEDAGFGFKLRCYNQELAYRYAYIDHIQVKIYYTPPPVIEPDPIPSGAVFGSATVKRMLAIVEPDPIASGAVFGSHNIYRAGDIVAYPLPSGATFGTAVVSREYVPKPGDILRINEIRVQVSMVEKSDSGSAVCSLEDRTNELLYSEQLNQAGSWTAANLTVSTDDTVSPDGVTSAERLQEASDTGQVHSISQDCATLTTGVDVTFSAHLKADERTIAKLRVINKAGTSFFATCTLDVDAPSISTEDACEVRVENYGAGWARYIMILDIATGATTPSFAILMADGTGAHTYNGDGASGLYAWGLQAEESDDTIDYIPTTTAAVTATASTKVDFNVEFIDVFSVTLSVASETMATAIYILRDVPYPWGFKVRVFDQAGTRIAKTVSWAAKGV